MEEAVAHWCNVIKKEDIAPIGRYNGNHNSTLNKQCDWLFWKSGEPIYDRLYRVEDLPDIWKQICQDVDATPCKLPHFKKGPRHNRHYTTFFTKKQAGIIGKQFADDCELFGYSFGD
jgi:hypothetical protein